MRKTRQNQNLGRCNDDVARPLCLLHCDLLRAGDGGGANPDHRYRDRLSQPEAALARTGSKRHHQALRTQRGGLEMSEPVTSDKLPSAEAAPPRRSILMALPLLVFATFAVLFWLRLGSGDPSKIPSAL